MTNEQTTIRPNDRFPYLIEGAANKIMVEILSGEKLTASKIKLLVKALEDAISDDGLILVAKDSTTWIEMSLLKGFEFDANPRSKTAPVLGMGSEQRNEKD